MAAAKRDFGSFHSSNVQELLNIPEVCIHCSYKHKEKHLSITGSEWKKKKISMSECNTILSAYTLYRHLG